MNYINKKIMINKKSNKTFITIIAIVIITIIISNQNIVIARQNGNNNYVCLDNEVKGFAYQPYLDLGEYTYTFDLYIPEQWEILYDFDETYGDMSQFSRIQLLEVNKNHVWIRDPSEKILGEIIHYSPENDRYMNYFPGLEFQQTRWFLSKNKISYFLGNILKEEYDAYERYNPNFYYFDNKKNKFVEIKLPIVEILDNEINVSVDLPIYDFNLIFKPYRR